MIDRDAFIEWANTHFDNVIIHGNEVQINDIWWIDEFGLPDSKNHCWVNTDKGCFHAFKSGKHGSVVRLVAEVEGCSWHEANALLGGENNIPFLQSRLEELFGYEEPAKITASVVSPKLPEGTYPIKDLSPNDPMRVKAENYLKSRKIAIGNLMVCVTGKFQDRIVIPYYDRNGNLIYFNSRALNEKDKLRYRGPDKDTFGVGKSDVLWMHSWPHDGSEIYLTEGEFDAMSLVQVGLHGGACGGKELGNKQIEMLRPYKITLAFDNDKAGKNSFKIGQGLIGSGFKDLYYVRPPQGFKDWNKLLVDHGEIVLKAYIEKEKKIFTQDTLTQLLFQTI